MTTPSNPTPEADWLDEAISFNVNRGLIHEDRWADLKAAINAKIAADYVPKGEAAERERAARTDEAKRAANHNNSEYTSDYLEGRIAELEATQKAKEV